MFFVSPKDISSANKPFPYSSLFYFIFFATMRLAKCKLCRKYSVHLDLFVSAHLVLIGVLLKLSNICEDLFRTCVLLRMLF